MTGRLPGALWSAAASVLAVSVSCNDGSAAARLAVATSAAVANPAARTETATAPAAAVQTGSFQLSGEPTQGGWLRGIAPAHSVSLAFDGAAVPFSADGSFIVAFDRDAGPAAVLTAGLNDGRTVTTALSIAPRAWNIEHIPIGPRPGAVPSEEFQRRRAAELAQIKAARAISADSEGWHQRFIWPVTGRISGYFGSQRIYRGTPGSYHSGIDIATGESGTPFVAPADGVVILAAASPFTLEGNLLMLDHGMGLNSAYLHCSALLVKEGDRVRQGQVIGRIGMTGRATGPHMHWSLKWRSARLDPLLFAGPMRWR